MPRDKVNPFWEEASRSPPTCSLVRLFFLFVPRTIGCESYPFTLFVTMTLDESQVAHTVNAMGCKFLHIILASPSTKVILKYSIEDEKIKKESIATFFCSRFQFLHVWSDKPVMSHEGSTEQSKTES